MSACFSTFITVYVIDAKYTTNTNVGVYTPTGILVIAIKLINSISQSAELPLFEQKHLKYLFDDILQPYILILL